MTWTFIWLMLLLKIPIVGMGWLVWWTIRRADQEPAGATEDDGGSKVDPRRQLHPRPPRPPRPRRGPHAGAPVPASPRRTRSVVAFAARVEH
jgi:hypothetical protein